MTPERRTAARKLLHSIAFSPYNWRYTLQLPRYLLRPGRRNETGMERPPLSQTLDDDAETAMTIVAGGDIIQTRGNEVPQFHDAVQDVLSRADLFVANCEAPVLASDDARERIVTFGMPVSYLEDILEQVPVPAERTLLSVASNHSRDQPEQVFRDGVELIQETGARTVGLHREDAPPHTVMDAGDLTIGFGSWTHLMNGETVLPDRTVVQRQDDARKTDWEAINEQEDLDLLVGIPHWDRSYQHFPADRTRRFAREMIGDRFDLLLGSHPHVVQPPELIDGQLCMYSRGNMASKHYLRYETRLRPIIEIDFSSDGDIVRYKIHLFVQHRTDDGLVIVPIEELPDGDQERYRELIETVFDTEPAV
jgi:poly-gamma-glutamate synthesis protein (capsule biosynthesis protein)